MTNITVKSCVQCNYPDLLQCVCFSGSYMYQPTAASTITYWSGFVDGVAKSISLSGKVTVTDRSDSIHSLMLKVNGYEAEHDVSTKGIVIYSKSKFILKFIYQNLFYYTSYINYHK